MYIKSTYTTTLELWTLIMHALLLSDISKITANMNNYKPPNPGTLQLLSSHAHTVTVSICLRFLSTFQIHLLDFLHYSPFFMWFFEVDYVYFLFDFVSITWLFSDALFCFCSYLCYNLYKPPNHTVVTIFHSITNQHTTYIILQVKTFEFNMQIGIVCMCGLH